MRRIVDVFYRVGLALVVLFSLVNVGCTKDEAEDNNTLVVALGSEPATLDPRYAKDANGMRIVSLMFNSLVKISPNLKVVGDAAESWTYSNNIYEFKLKKGLSFSNGNPLTAEDILFTFDEYRRPRNPFHSALEIIDDVKVREEDGRLIVQLKLKHYSATLLSSDLPVVKLLPKNEIKKFGDDFGRDPVGTGSFAFKDKKAKTILLTARRDHAYAPPKIDNLMFKVISNDFTLYQKTLKGSVDIAQAEIPPSKVKEFIKREGEFQVFKYPGLSFTYILINLKDKALQNRALRQALAQAVNRGEIIKYKLEGLAQEATSILTPTNPFFSKALANPPFDLEKAQSIVNKLGLVGSELTLKTSNSQQAIDNGKVLANQLSKTGLNVTLQSFEWGTFFDDVQKGNFELATMRWIGAMDPDIYRIAFHSHEKPPGRNRGSYENPILDKLLDEGLSIEDESARIKHYYKVQQIVHDDLAIIPLWYDQQVAVINRRVRDYQPAMNGDFSPFIRVSKDMSNIVE